MSTLILITMIVQWIIFVAIAVLSYWLVKEIKRMEQDYVKWSDIGSSHSHSVVADSQGWHEEITEWNKEVKEDE